LHWCLLYNPGSTLPVRIVATGHESRVSYDHDQGYSFQLLVDELQSQVDAIDVKLADRHNDGFGAHGKSLVDLLKEEESVARLIRDRKGTAVINLKGADVALLEQKTTITSGAVGGQQTGVLRIDRIGGITREARESAQPSDVASNFVAGH
jgi:hypothetical protein